MPGRHVGVPALPTFRTFLVRFFFCIRSPKMRLSVCAQVSIATVAVQFEFHFFFSYYFHYDSLSK